MNNDYADHPPIPVMLQAERKGVAFHESLMECADNKVFVREFDRLTGNNLSMEGSGLDLMIDESSGRMEKGVEEFVHFCWEYVFSRF